MRWLIWDATKRRSHPNLGRNQEAIASYDKALEIKPDDHQAWLNRGVALRYLGRNQEAIASWDKALEIKPDDHQAWLNRGVALRYLGRNQEAIASWDKALEIKPDDHQAWLNRGVVAGKSFSYNPFPSTISAITIQNRALNQRGYDGELASYHEGLKYCQQHTHPEDWGMLHQAIGKAHYFQGVGKPNYRKYWRDAENEYRQALITLTQKAFPELHLKLVRDLIRVLFGLNKDDEAKQWRRHGLEVFRELINSPQKSSAILISINKLLRSLIV
ncbi:MAG: tetratricopeptide repeat protein [Nostochopsis sp.]